MMTQPDSDAACSRAPRLLATLSVALLAILAPGAARAESPWSAIASGGIVLPFGQGLGGTNAGGWVDLLHTVVPNWSIGGEAGWFALPGASYGIPDIVRPGFQLRWHETLGPEHDYIDVVTFEAGVHFN